MTATQNPAQDVSDQSIAAAFREYCHYFPCATITVKHWVQNRAKEIESARELQQAQVVGLPAGDPSMQPGYPGDAAVAKAFRVESTTASLDTEIAFVHRVTRLADTLATPQSSAPVVGGGGTWVESVQRSHQKSAERANFNRCGCDYCDAIRRDAKESESALTGRD